MIEPKLNPVEWSSLLFELEDAKEHLSKLIKTMESEGVNEEEFEVQLGHAFAHLNRAWNTRNTLGDYGEDERVLFSSFPIDLQPCG